VTLLPANQVDADLVGLWHMDGSWKDYSGNGNHLSPVNSADFTTDAQVGSASHCQCAVFNRYARRLQEPVCRGQFSATYAAWIKPYSYPDATL